LPALIEEIKKQLEEEVYPTVRIIMHSRLLEKFNLLAWLDRKYLAPRLVLHKPHLTLIINTTCCWLMGILTPSLFITSAFEARALQRKFANPTTYNLIVKCEASDAEFTVFD